MGSGRVVLIVAGAASLTAGAVLVLHRLWPVESDDGAKDDTSMSGQLVEAWEHGVQVGQLLVEEVDGVLMEVGLAASWRALRDAAAAAGVTLRATSGFRTMEQQRQLWAEHESGKRPTPVARPGFSNHQNGRALDIAVRSSNTSPEYAWLHAHAVGYGFSNTGAHFSPPEWWHWEVSGGFV